jgi:hypothetical protein
VYFVVIWYFLWSFDRFCVLFGTVCGHLVYFYHFGLLSQVKSDNPEFESMTVVGTAAKLCHAQGGQSFFVEKFTQRTSKITQNVGQNIFFPNLIQEFSEKRCNPKLLDYLLLCPKSKFAQVEKFTQSVHPAFFYSPSPTKPARIEIKLSR